MKKRTPPIILVSIALLLFLAACALPGLNRDRTPQPLAAGPTAPALLTATAAPTQPLVITATLPAAPSSSATVPSAASSVPLKITNTPQPAAPTASAAPAATKTAVPAAGLTPIIFTLSGSPDIPTGIFPQIGVFQIGGGANSAEPAGCNPPSGGLSWCHPLNGAILAVTSDFTGQACGFGSGPISASLTLPGGSTRPANTNGEPPGCRTITYTPRPDDPLGTYQVTVTQADKHLVDSFTLAIPTAPASRLYNNCIWIAGLKSTQPVRVQAFGLVIPGPKDPLIDPSLATWRFLGEGGFTSASGQSLLACPDAAITDKYPELAYLAYPPGGIQLLAGDPDLLEQFQGNCANGPSSRLAVGKQARVLAKNLPLLSDPSLNSSSPLILHQGAVVSVLNGPVCPPQGPWAWQVKTNTGQTGWLAESDTTTYFLEPISK
jgi:hypothetical protein